MNKEEMPVIQITPPEVKVVQKNNITINEYNYDNSHLIYKLFDAGSFKEIVNMKKENTNLKQALNEIRKYYKKISNLYWVVDDEPKYVQEDILEIIDKYTKEDDKN